MTSILNYQDRATCVLFGDGAGAVLLEPRTVTTRASSTLFTTCKARGENIFTCLGWLDSPRLGRNYRKKMHYIHQEGAQVFKYAVRRMAELACEMLERNGFTSRDLALVVPHQATANYPRDAGKTRH